mmetsp:Transcript_4416/g.13028  ORF Transcript_4416/g.13028 Transcript_4416/m.13028 type:complete len:266 (+) Transcript_4416:798-1595(+)
MRQLEEGRPNDHAQEEDDPGEDEDNREKHERVKVRLPPRVDVVQKLGQVEQRVALVEHEEGHHAYFREAGDVRPDHQREGGDVVELHHEAVEPADPHHAFQDEGDVPADLDEVVRHDLAGNLLHAEVRVAPGRVEDVTPLEARPPREQAPAEGAQHRAAHHQPDLLLELVHLNLDALPPPVRLEPPPRGRVHRRPRRDEDQGYPRRVLERPEPRRVKQRHDLLGLFAVASLRGTERDTKPFRRTDDGLHHVSVHTNEATKRKSPC